MEYTLYLEPSYWPLEPQKCIKFNLQQIIIEYKENEIRYRAQVWGRTAWEALEKAFWLIYSKESEGD